ncbi:acetoacetyl-CoA synthetase [Trichonephila clavipes]|nr:acetoacetyl-CoA synthetase [Trichonephila clavipes]
MLVRAYVHDVCVGVARTFLKSVLENPRSKRLVTTVGDENIEEVRKLINKVPQLTVGMIADELQINRYWSFGDDGWQNPVTKGFIVFGRSDETMNPKGARFNCGDIYFTLEGFPGVMDSVCVSQFNSEMDERVILFVKMLSGYKFTSEVADAIKKTIGHHLTHEHVPDIILEAPDIPFLFRKWFVVPTVTADFEIGVGVAIFLHDVTFGAIQSFIFGTEKDFVEDIQAKIISRCLHHRRIFA